MMDIDNVSSSLEAAQRESLMAQQRSQQGLSNLVGAGTTLGMGALQDRKKKNTTDPNNTGNTGQVGGLLNFWKDMVARRETPLTPRHLQIMFKS